MAARNQVPAWVYLVLVVVILLTAWLNRYRYYHEIQQRQNRFTGEVEQRVDVNGHVEWHVIPNGRVDLPAGSGMVKPLDRPPKQ